MAVYDVLEDAQGAFFLCPEDMEKLKLKYKSEVIYAALLKLYELTRKKEEGEEINGELEPCPICSGLNFMRTGNCHVCTTCGTSQGCS